jgi:hypothetical protein
VYVYRNTGSAWVQAAKLVPSDSGNGDQVGYTMALKSNLLAFSSRATMSTNGPGRVHVYRLDSGAPLLETVLSKSLPPQALNFGWSISTDGARLAISDIGDTALQPQVQGAVFVYRYENGAWIEEQTIRPSPVSSPVLQFGQEVAIDGHDLVVTSFGPPRMWHFRRVGGTWIELGEAATPAVSGYDITGLDLQAGLVAVGSPTTNVPMSTNGAVYTFDANSSTQACTYCTAKTNSEGCTPQIGFSGVASASAGSGFTINASQVRAGKSGLLFYSRSVKAATAFQGGTLCMLPPLKRTPGQVAGGSGVCQGSYNLDFNAFIATGNDPALVAGSVVRGQFWSRDNGFVAPHNTGLSDAISFVIAP